MFRSIATLATMLALSGCVNTVMQVTKVDSATGYFPSTSSAEVVTNTPLDLDARRGLLLTPSGGFTTEMAQNIGYFDEVIDFEELEKRIIASDLSDRVPSIRERIGINNAARHYGDFLWLRWDVRREGTRNYQRLILTDPLTMTDHFVAETYLDTVWAGVSDRRNAYPAMNALIDYLVEHSETFRK